MSHQRQESLDATIMQIEKQFGKGAIMRLGDEDAPLTANSISTGSLSKFCLARWISDQHDGLWSRRIPIYRFSQDWFATEHHFMCGCDRGHSLYMAL